MNLLSENKKKSHYVIVIFVFTLTQWIKKIQYDKFITCARQMPLLLLLKPSCIGSRCGAWNLRQGSLCVILLLQKLGLGSSKMFSSNISNFHHTRVYHKVNVIREAPTGNYFRDEKYSRVCQQMHFVVHDEKYSRNRGARKSLERGR